MQAALLLLLRLTMVPCSCCSQLSQATSAPLVGNVAPDFTAQAVFDQEFMEISLSQYRVLHLCCLSTCVPAVPCCLLTSSTFPAS